MGISITQAFRKCHISAHFIVNEKNEHLLCIEYQKQSGCHLNEK